MATLVYLESHDGELTKGGLGLLGKAASLGGDVAGVVLGSGVRDAAAKAGPFGAATVYVVDDGTLAAPLPQPRVDALEAVVRESGAENVFFPASVLASDVAAGLAARLEAGLNWDLTDLRLDGGDLVGVRPALGDTVLVDVGWTATPRLALVRSGTFDPVETGGTADVKDVAATFQDFSTQAALVDHLQEESSGPSIEEADVIVAGGRGLGGRRASRIARSSPPRSGAPSPRRAPWSMRAGTRTPPRSARPGRRSPRSSTSRSASRARSSTRSECRARARSSR